MSTQSRWVRVLGVVLVLVIVASVAALVRNVLWDWIYPSPDVQVLQEGLRNAPTPEDWMPADDCPTDVILRFESSTQAKEALAGYQLSMEQVVSKSLDIKCDIQAGAAIGCHMGADLRGVVGGASADTLPSRAGSDATYTTYIKGSIYDPAEAG